ncbi:hypothetical protein Vadar_034545 [Vaccinium darrowii]|uniref:Uncharacterized protein n=1 Tax=Vaccinium darrowii TaxID=229202 RepID=A0ACB7ZG58_9ERIC|nr:hypothetical protein Vadar_034545 [Vaccinium darrowii]
MVSFIVNINPSQHKPIQTILLSGEKPNHPPLSSSSLQKTTTKTINVRQMENNDQFVRRENAMPRPRGVMLGGRRRPMNTKPPGHRHSSSILPQKIQHENNLIFYDSASMQGSMSSTTCHVVYGFFITTLIGILQLKYQNKKVSPFETHLTPIRTFVATMCIYSLAMVGKIIAKKYSAKCYEIFSHVSILSGALSSVSLATIFLPPSLSSLIMFIIWAIFFAIVALYLFHTLYKWLYQKIAVAIVQVLELFASFMGQSSMEPQHLPV